MYTNVVGLRTMSIFNNWEGQPEPVNQVQFSSSWPVVRLLKNISSSTWLSSTMVELLLNHKIFVELSYMTS